MVSDALLFLFQSGVLTKPSRNSVNLYFPLVGLINLFLHVIQHPDLPTANSDITLLDTIVGHFGYLEFASGSELGANVPRKIVSYAREIVQRQGRISTSVGLQEASAIHNPFDNSDVFEGLLDFSVPEVSIPSLYSLGSQAL